MIQLEQPNLPYFVLSVSECIGARPILKFSCDYCDVSVVIDGPRIADFQLAVKLRPLAASRESTMRA